MGCGAEQSSQMKHGWLRIVFFFFKVSAFSATRELQTKTLRFHLTPIRTAKIREGKDKCRQGCGKWDHW